MKKTIVSLSLLLALSAGSISVAQQTSGSGNTSANGNTAAMLGNMSQQEFDRINREGAAKVKAIKPTKEALSSADQELIKQVAKGGMMQLEVSKVAASKATNESVRKLAESEVEEQTTLSEKLIEMASTKGVTLPSSPDEETKAMVTKLQAMPGAELDRYYVQESGVKGHQKLDQVMSKVESGAKDTGLKSLAAAAHPLVKTHLQVSQSMLSKMSKSSGAGSSGK